MLAVLVAGCLLASGPFAEARDEAKKEKSDRRAEIGFQREEECVGWLWPRGRAHVPSERYCPREGDLLLMTAIAPGQELVYLLGRTNHPFHSAIVVSRADGVLACLETGGGGAKITTLRPVGERLRYHANEYPGGVIQVRRIHRDLTPCESERLTVFAESQIGKPFVTTKRALQLIKPGRIKTPSGYDNEDWFCSELVMQSLTASGLVRTPFVAGALVPTDIYHDRKVHFENLWHLPQEWTECRWMPDRRPPLAPSPTRPATSR